MKRRRFNSARVHKARAVLSKAAGNDGLSFVAAVVLALFTGAISFVASTFTSMYRESDNAGIRDADRTELRAQLIRCRDREADRTDAWMRLLYGRNGRKPHGSNGE